MATSLFQHGGINTTVAKAKELRPSRGAAHHPRAGAAICTRAGSRAAAQGQGRHDQSCSADR